MQAAVVNVPGERPKYQSFADPAAAEGEVLIKVHAAGLHPVVKAIATGVHYAAAKAGAGPSIPGIDAVGTLPDGGRVYFGFVRKPWGTMAEQAAAPGDKFIPVPDALADATAAAIANPGMSAWMTLKERRGLAAGETVLIMGATGVAGQLAIQVARYLGAKRVIAAGRNVDAVAKADVDAIIPLTQPEDAIREALTAEAAQKGFKAEATRRIRLVEVGESAGKTITLHGATLRSIDLTILGSGFGAARLDRIFAAIPALFDLAAKGILTIDLDSVPLVQVEAAWNRVEKGR